MKMKKMVNYRIPFFARPVTWCCAMLGLSVFLRFLHYFMPFDPDGLNAGVWILRIILPTLLCVSFGVLLRLVHLRSPGVYGILAANMCLMLMLWDIMDGGILEIVLSVLTMLILGCSLFVTIGGCIPTRSIACFWLLVVFCLRLFSGSGSLTASLWLDRLSELSILAALFFFTISLKPYSE